MAMKSAVGPSARQEQLLETDLTSALSQAFGWGIPGYESLNGAFQDGVQVIAAEMKSGNLTEEQAHRLIELFVSAYTGAVINQQINALLQGWSGQLESAGSGGQIGRK
jgi:hypothetical protein